MATLIVGAGLAGLAAAHELEQRGEDFILVEKSDHVGGVVASPRKDGFLLERGPRTVAGNAPTLAALIKRAALSDRIVHSNAVAQRRYIWSRDRLHCVPHSATSLLTTGLLSVGGRLRILAEPFISRGGHNQETIAEFVTRRFGAEAASRLADPMCAGVFGGLPTRLGIDAFARAAELEHEHGSVVRGMAKTARERRARGEPMHTLMSFANGLQELTDALGEHFREALRLSTTVKALRRSDDGFEADLESASGETSISARGVILAAPAPATAELLSDLQPRAAGALSSIRHAPIAVVALGFAREAVEHPLDGFGLLCCSDSPVPEGRPVLGVLFSSSIFEGRAPSGTVLLEVMIGGDRNPEALGGSDEELVARAYDACKSLLGVSQAATFQHVIRWAPVLPQYEPGHAQRIDELETMVDSLGPLALAGNYLRGVGVEGAAASGVAAVRSLLARAAIPA